MRQNLLESAWTGPPLTLNGRELVLSPGRHSLLGYWKNAFFSENATQTPIAAMGELVMICYLTREELRGVQQMSDEMRSLAVIEFMLEHEDALTEVQEGIQARMEAVKAAVVESESPGKEDAAHVS